MKNRNIHMSIFMTTFLLLISFCEVKAQVFVEVTGALNPLDGEDLSEYSAPAFIDLDDDGDLDAMMGETFGGVLYFENTGDRVTPSFTQRTGSNNPMDGIDVGWDAAPGFVDIDDDEDFDLFVGNWDGKFKYFENIGSRDTPIYVEITGTSNPLNAFDIGRAAKIRFMDMDNDGDWDAISGAENGEFQTYENTGTASSPVYDQLTGAANPLDGIDTGTYSSPAFIDVDLDGDHDIISGKDDGTFLYIKNTGTVDAPVFVEQADADNPMNGEDAGKYCVPVSVDLNFDSSADLIVGNETGLFHYYRGSGGGSPLPIELVSFEAEPTVNEQVKMNWVTAAEMNNEYFTIERSRDVVNFEAILFVDGAGNSNSTIVYHAFDENPYSGQSYYRLKQTDFDGKFTYSDIQHIYLEPSVSPALTIYPNPSDQNQIYADVLGSSENSILMLEIIDIQGRCVFKKYVNLNGITARIDLDPSLPKGIYHVFTMVGNKRLQQKFLRN